MSESTVVERPRLEPVGVDGSFSLPLSHEQARLWFLAQMNPADTAYHMAYRIRLTGVLDVSSLAAALDKVVDRHEALRARFVEVNGHPRQVISAHRKQSLEMMDLRACELSRGEMLLRLETDIVQSPFDLSSGELLRMRLVRLGEAEHSLIVVMHHIIGDGWSHAVFVRDIGSFYRATVTRRVEEAPVPLKIQYSDYALWQLDFTQSAQCEEQVRSWVEGLRTVKEELRLPRDSLAKPTPRGGATLRFCLAGTLAASVADVLEKERWMLSSLLLAAYEAVLARLADQESFHVGIAMANRTTEEAGDLIGFFVNTLALSSDTAAGQSFSELVSRVQHRLLEAQAHQSMPLELIAAGCGVAGRSASPLIKALFVLQNTPAPHFELAGVSAVVERIHTGTSKFELTLFATEAQDAIECELEYDTRVFGQDTVENVRDMFLDIISLIATSPEQPVFGSRLTKRARPSILCGPRRQEWLGQTIPNLVSAQSVRVPESVAIEDGERRITYSTLFMAQRSFASRLRQTGVAPGERIAVLLPHSAELVVALLGIMSARAAYFPINPELPQSYLERAIDRCRPHAFVLGDGKPLPGVTGARIVSPPDLSSTLASDYEAEEASQPSDLAYVMCTSGSTGEAKAVLVEQAGLANVCLWIASTLQLQPDDRCLLKTPITFDAVGRELYPILIAGGTLIIAEPDAHRDMLLLRRNLERSAATVLHCVPSQLQTLLETSALPSSLRAVMCGGEKLPARVAEGLRKQNTAQLWNVYGPTEATVDATAVRIEADLAQEHAPIGTPIPNMGALIVDSSGQPVSLGATGEIVLCGIGVARGYLEDEETKQLFRFDPETGQRQYRTGDRGRIGSGGVIEFLGRIDRQLKRHGVRLEPATIEKALLGFPQIGAAHVVMVPPAISGRPERLVAFVAPQKGQAFTPPHSSKGPTPTDWHSVFEASYETLPMSEDPLSNAHGWISSFDRLPIPSVEIISAAEEAAHRIRRWKPRRVLEIGCGTGLILFRVAPECELYHGVDFAAQPLRYVHSHAETAGLKHLRLTQASALDFEPESSAVFDAIVLNSVAQYLSSPADLSSLLERLTHHLAPCGFFFLGDVRDLRLAATDHFGRALRRASPKARCASVLIAAQMSQARDEELCLNPAFFLQWVNQAVRRGMFHPPILEPKSALGENELAKYRLDITLARKEDGRSSAELCEGGSLVGKFRNRLIESDMAVLKRARAIGPDAPLAQLFSPLPVCNQNATCLSPREAIYSASQSQSKATLFLAIQLSPDPVEFSLFSFDTAVSLAEFASIAGYRGEEPSLAEAPRNFGSFLAATEGLSAYLRTCLPSYEMPDQVVRLPALPLTLHGKIDYQCLRVAAEDDLTDACESESHAEAEGANPTEKTICEVFKAVVGVRFRREDDFFARGGHSLLATQVRARLEKSFSVTVPLRVIFERPSAAMLAPYLQDLQKAAASIQPRILPREKSTPAMPSHAQARLWFIEELGTAQTVYNMSHVVRMDGLLRLEVFDLAVGDLIARHAPLRSRFPERSGQPTVVIDPPASCGLLEIVAGGEPLTLEQAIDILTESSLRPFDLQHDRLLRVYVARLEPRGTGTLSHLVCMVAHHIVADGWSIALALTELAAFYNQRLTGIGTIPPPLAIDYYDMAAWQGAAAERGLFEEDLRFWQEQLQGAPPRLSLPFDFPLPATRSWRGGKIAFGISEELSDRLREIALEEHATLFMTLMAAFQVLLYKLSGEKDFVVGTVVANRYRAELEPLVGFLVNPLAIRAVIEPEEDFSRHLQRVKEKAISAFDHQGAPFELILERLQVDRHTNYQAVFQTLFAMQNAGIIDFKFEGIQCTRIPLRSPGAMFDLSLEARESPGGLQFELEYSADLFHIDTARLIAQRFEYLLVGIASNPVSAIRDLTIVPPHELALLLRFSRGPASGAQNETLPHRLFAEVEKHPTHVAIEDGSEIVTYGELGASVSFMASKLKAANVQRGDIVAVHLPRGIAVAVASFAVQCLGAAPLYLDPTLPAVRKSSMISETNAKVGVCSDKAAAALPEACWLELPPIPELVEASRGWTFSFIQAATPEDYAFATFTSGSSGHPKVVAVPQRSIALRLRGNDLAVSRLSEDDRVAHAYSFNYDGGLITLFWPLCSGATVVFLPLHLLGEASGLAASLRSHKITVFDAIPVVLNNLFKSVDIREVERLRLVITGGDVCPPDLPQRVLDRADVVFVNQYGPCEAVVNATAWSCDRTRLCGPATIGAPLPDTDVYVVDTSDRLAPIGVVGEILIGGPALADGYLNSPELTAQKFVFLDLDGAGPKRFYRSGDLGRWRKEGDLEFCGRLDRQVKVRGMRSDPAEIEVALRSSPMVAECHVATQGDSEDNRFVAYVAPTSETLGQAAQEPIHIDDRRSEEWRELFDALYRTSKSKADALEPDFAGWDDTATGKPIPLQEMELWRTATLERIRTFPFRRVLEIGAGVGLLALPLAANAEEYVATDFSAVAVERLKRSATDLGLKKLKAHCLGASELSRLAGMKFDLIILNSVLQYFPSANFAREVLSCCVKLLAPHGRIFIGDVRDVRLSQLFHCEVATLRAGPEADACQLRSLAAEGQHLDEELQLAPAFFEGLSDGNGANIRALPLLKIRSGRSELACYRYDVWLTKETATRPNSERPKQFRWSSAPRFSLELENMLHESPWLPIVVLDIPNTRFHRAMMFVSRLAANQSVEHATVTAQAPDPDDFADLGVRSTRTAIICPGQNSTHFDATFLPRGASDPFDAPRLSALGVTPLSNNPTLGRRIPRLRAMLEAHLVERLPEHLRPDRYVFMDQLPLRSGGKIDTHALAELALPPARRNEHFTDDLTFTVMADIWRSTIGCDELSADSDFFRLGGHSLLATRLAAAIRREFAVDFPVIRVFELRTVSAVIREVLRLRRSGVAKGKSIVTIPAIDWTRRCNGHGGTVELSRHQRFLLSRTSAIAPPRHIGVAVEVSVSVDEAMLDAALADIAEIHPILRRSINGKAPLPGKNLLRVTLLQGDPAHAIAEIEKPMVHADAPLAISLISHGARASILCVRAHPAVFDGDSLALLFQELTLAIQNRLDGEPICDRRVPTDYAALALFAPSSRTRNDRQMNVEPLALRRTRRCHEAKIVREVTWTENDTKHIDGISHQIGVTSCALLLGCLATELSRGREKVVIECPMSLRTVLAAEQVIGPLSVDVPFVFSRDEVGSIHEAAIASAERILAAFDDPLLFEGAPWGAAYGQFAFSYHTGPADLRLASARWRTRVVAQVSPTWHALKLSARRTAGKMQLRMVLDPALLPGEKFEKLMEAMHHELMNWRPIT